MTGCVRTGILEWWRNGITGESGSPARAAAPSMPIAYEDRLVVPGTTIKLTSSACWRGPLAWRQRTTASGAGAVTYIGPTVVTCLEIRWPTGFWLADRLPLVTASRRPGGRL